MNRFTFTTSLATPSAAIALCTLSSCGILADEIAEEATQELAIRVEHQLESAASDAGLPTNDYKIMKAALRDVILEEAGPETGSFQPRYTGLVDDDHDGFDDDGQVAIVVRRDSSRVRAEGNEATVIPGPCPDGATIRRTGPVEVGPLSS